MRRWTSGVRFGIFFKVTALFVTALLMAVASLVMFNMMQFRNATLEVSGRIRSQSHRSLELSVENKLHEYANILYNIVTDSEIRLYLQKLDSGDAQGYSMAASQLGLRLQSYAYTSSDILGITLISGEQHLVLHDRTPHHIRNMWQEDRASGRLDALVEDARSARHVIFTSDTRHPGGKSIIHVQLAIWDLYTHEHLGVLVMAVDAATLWELIGSSAAEQDAFDFLALPDGSLLVHPDYAVVGERLAGYTLDCAVPALCADDMAAGTVALPAHAETSVRKIDRYPVYLISVVNPGMYDEMINRYARMASVLVELIALVFGFLFLAILRGMMESMREVIAGIEKIRGGNLDIRIAIPPKDEIFYIAEALNTSLESLQSTSRERDQEFLRFLRESERRRKAEIASLQSQINSHFLYNTLNVINYCALEGDNKKTSKMIKSLASCLRYTLNKHWDLVMVSEEVDWLEQYLLLQKERQPSLFTYRIDAAPETMSLPIHKLIIQPFVENAIAHGFVGSKTTRTLEISIRLLRAPDRLAIRIHDDGAGIPAEKLGEIEQLLRDYQTADGLGIGIENVCFRLNIHYKQNARIFVRSRPGMGTTFYLLLPVQSADDAANPPKELPPT